MREELLRQARMTALTIDIHRMTDLSGSSADLLAPDYQRLKKQFINARRLFPRCRFLYVMGQHPNGDIFIYIDSEPPDSKDYSPPGQIYKEASDDVLAVFSTRQEAIKGPATDRWGTWMSAFIPLRGAASRSAPVIFGMDIDASTWRRTLWKKMIVPVALSLVFILILIAGSFLLQTRKEIPFDRQKPFLRYAETLVAAAVGTMITLMLAHMAHEDEHRSRRNAFLQLSEMETENVVASFSDQFQNRLKNFSYFFEASQEVTQEEFRIYVAGVGGTAPVHAWAWAPVVDEPMKRQLEAVVGLDKTNLFKVWEKDATGKPCPVPERALYYPVLYVEPRTDNPSLPGFDLGSETIRRSALLKAARDRIATATDPVALAHENPPEKGIFVFQPVFDEKNKTGLRGFVVAVLSPNVILRQSVSRGDVKSPAVIVEYFQQKENDAPIFLGASFLQNNAQSLRLPWGGGSSQRIAAPLFLFGNSYFLSIVPGPAFLSLYPFRAGWMTALAGLLFTALLTLFSGFLALRRSDLERQVMCRTGELTQSHRILNETTKQLEWILGITGTGITIIDPDFNLHFVDDTLRRTYGDPEGKTCYAYFKNRKTPCTSCGLSIARQTREITVTEEIFPGEGNRVVEIHTIPFTTPEGDWRFAQFRLDVTLRKLAENVLRESEEKFRTMVEKSPIGIAIVNDNYQYAYINEKFSSICGYPKEELIGTHFAAIVSEESRDQALELYLRRQKGEQVQDRYEFSFIHKNGETRYGEVQSAVYRDKDGRANSIIQVSDISDRRRMETEKEKLQAQLLQSQKMESVGRLAGGVAHDFNNMLMVILGHSQMGLQEISDFDPSQPGAVQSFAQRFREINDAALRSADLVRQLLAFARKQTVTPRILDLNEAVSGTLKMLKRLIGEQIDLVWIPDQNIGKVKMDPSQIDQILANLMVNARDAISGVGKITIETRHVVVDDAYCRNHEGFASGEYVELAISDNGSGMSREVIDHIFDPFFTTKEVGRGTGLGLATVYGIIKQNNGSIHVYSEIGKGTTFRIHLPRIDGQRDVSIRPPAADGMPQGTETVMLVEDEEMILDFARILLRKLGYTVISAATPEAALRLAGESRIQIDLLITDVILPEMNGPQLAERLSVRYPGLKVLFMSGYTADAISRHGVLEKGTCFIQKPFAIQELAEKIREALGG